jgi:DNA-binding CsgD family transcriptional regulator
LATLQDHLVAAIDGHGSVVLLGGEAGIGKTTLCDRLASDARLAGAVVAWGRCLEGDVAPPFGPWLSVFRSWAEQAGPTAAAAAFGPSAEMVARLLPELVDESEIAGRSALEGAGAQFRLTEALGETVARMGTERPFVVLLDDFQWSDASSVAVTESVGRAIVESPVLLVTAYRDTELSSRAAESVNRLARLPRARRTDLVGLDELSVARCAAAVSGDRVSPEIAHELWTRTGGNPFFVTELARLGVDADRLPEGIRALMHARLSRLPADTVPMLEAAAVIGNEFRDDWLADAVGIGVADVLDQLEPVVAARFVDAASIGRHQFAHDLVRETLLDGMTVAARAQLHARVGETIERAVGAAVDEHLDELAAHYTEAARLGDVDRAVAYRERAARHAQDNLAYVEAAQHLEHACTLAELDTNIGLERRCDLLLALGDAWSSASDFDRARVAFERAMVIARSLRDPDRLAAAAFAHTGRMRLERVESSIPLLDEAMDAVVDDVPRARLLASRAMAVPLDRIDEKRERANEAWRVATAADDALAIALAARARCHTMFEPAQIDNVMELADMGLAAARRTGDAEQVLDALAIRWLVAAYRGDFEDLDWLDTEHRVEIGRLRRPLDVLNDLSLSTRRHLLRGEFDVAEQSISTQEEFAARFEWPEHMDLVSVHQRFWLRWWQGRARELADDVIAAAKTSQWLMFDLYSGLVEAQRGDVERVRSILGEIVPVMLRSGRGAWGKPAELVLASELALAAGDRPTVELLLDALREHAGLHAHNTLCFYIAPCDYAIGRLGAAVGDHDAAVAALESAVGFTESVRARPQCMAARAALAEVLQRRGRAEDGARARALLDGAIADARAMQLPYRVEQYEALRNAPPRGRIDGITERENDVLALLATGCTNQQIAAHLHLSVKTVERHLGNLYRKLGVANRTEAAAYAIRHSPD